MLPALSCGCYLYEGVDVTCMKVLSYLHEGADVVAVTEYLTKVLGTQYVSEGSLCQQSGGSVSVLHVSDGDSGILNAVIHHSVYSHCH